MDSYLSVIGLLQMLVAKIIKQLIDLLTPSTLVPVFCDIIQSVCYVVTIVDSKHASEYFCLVLF